MADRGSHRGARGAHRGSGGRGGRGAHGGERGGHAHAHAHGGDREKPKKENILDLNRFMDKSVCVTFSGGREGAHEFLSIPWDRADNGISYGHAERFRRVDESRARRRLGDDAR